MNRPFFLYVTTMILEKGVIMSMACYILLEHKMRLGGRSGIASVIFLS